VIVKIREDESKHRDRNHSFADAYESNNLPAHQS
jgi:ubiquinol oxidase